MTDEPKKRRQIFTPGALPRQSKEVAPHCIADGCENAVRSRGLCNTHYRNWYKHGDVYAPPKKKAAPALEWLADAIAQETDDCILSPFQRSKDGYARFTIEGRMIYASRHICEKVYGPPPTDKHQSAHSCGNGRNGCVNKRHLVWKTPKENIADKWQHGTMLVGIRHPMAKLNEAQVKEIRHLAAQHSRKELAAMFGVKIPTIDNIMTGATWRHV
jgi:hypothetical protein